MFAPDSHTRPSTNRVPLSSWLGWAAALAASTLALFLGARLLTLEREVSLAKTDAEVSHADSQALKQQLEAERILASRQISELQSALIRHASAATLIRLTPPAATAAQPEETAPSATLVWYSDAAEGLLFAEHLPVLPAGQEYRVWVEDASGARIAGGALPATTPDLPVAKIIVHPEVKPSAATAVVVARTSDSSSAESSSLDILTGRLRP